eukprot:2312398-Pyramimonas_sp.AAC.2
MCILQHFIKISGLNSFNGPNTAPVELAIGALATWESTSMGTEGTRVSTIDSLASGITRTPISHTLTLSVTIRESAPEATCSAISWWVRKHFVGGVTC